MWGAHFPRIAAARRRPARSRGRATKATGRAGRNNAPNLLKKNNRPTNTESCATAVRWKDSPYIIPHAFCDTTSDTAIEPRQPSRLEKNTNIAHLNYAHALIH